MGRLEALLAFAAKRITPARRAALLTALDRALADPVDGYLRKLRIERSRAVRELVAAGWKTDRIAEHLGISASRTRQIIHNNRSYVSAERELALEALRDQVAEKRAAKAAAAQAVKAARAASARAGRVTLGQTLQARISAGTSREALQDELGWSRQKLAGLLAEASAEAVVEAQDLPAAA